MKYRTFRVNESRKKLIVTIVEFMDEHGYSPTRRELMTAIPELGSTAAVDYHLVVMQKDGWISVVPRVHRGIRVLKNPYGEGGRYATQ